MVENNIRSFLQSKVHSEPAALMSKGLVTRKVKTQRARGSGRADNATPSTSEVTEILPHKTLVVTTALRWPSATKISWEATFGNKPKQTGLFPKAASHPKLRSLEVSWAFPDTQLREFPTKVKMGKGGNLQPLMRVGCFEKFRTPFKVMGSKLSYLWFHVSEIHEVPHSSSSNGSWH